jgi:hypothetical protein
LKERFRTQTANAGIDIDGLSEAGLLARIHVFLANEENFVACSLRRLWQVAERPEFLVDMPEVVKRVTTPILCSTTIRLAAAVSVGHATRASKFIQGHILQVMNESLSDVARTLPELARPSFVVNFYEGYAVKRSYGVNGNRLCEILLYYSRNPAFASVGVDMGAIQTAHARFLQEESVGAAVQHAVQGALPVTSNGRTDVVIGGHNHSSVPHIEMRSSRSRVLNMF